MADELYGINHERVLAKTKHIYDAILEVYKDAENSGKQQRNQQMQCVRKE